MDQDVVELLELPDDELWLLLARETLPFRAAPVSKSQLIRDAKAWLEHQKPKIREILQKSPAIHELVMKDPGDVDSVLLASMLVDAISGSLIGVSATTVSVVLVRYGVSKFLK